MSVDRILIEHIRQIVSRHKPVPYPEDAGATERGHSPCREPRTSVRADLPVAEHSWQSCNDVKELASALEVSESGESEPRTNQAADDPPTLFERRLDELRAPYDTAPAVIHASGQAEVAAALNELCAEVPEDDIIWWGDDSPCPREWRIGVTPALALVASTGTVALDLPSATHAWSSLLVDTHVVVASVDQLFPDLTSLYEQLTLWRASGRISGYQVCVTGCSRTADIEKRLIIPAHGPRRLRVILCDSPIEWSTVRSAFDRFRSL